MKGEFSVGVEGGVGGNVMTNLGHGGERKLPAGCPSVRTRDLRPNVTAQEMPSGVRDYVNNKLIIPEIYGELVSQEAKWRKDSTSQQDAGSLLVGSNERKVLVECFVGGDSIPYAANIEGEKVAQVISLKKTRGGWGEHEDVFSVGKKCPSLRERETKSLKRSTHQRGGGKQGNRGGDPMHEKRNPNAYI